MLIPALLAYATCALFSNQAHTAAVEPQRPDPGPDVEVSDGCPEPYGFFADAEQCDKYYQCVGGQITEKLCPDGHVFNDLSSDREKCVLPFEVDCSARPELQRPQPSEHCPRKHGYFAHEQRGVCNKFYFCVDGRYNSITCPKGLVFDEKLGICSWPDEANRGGCTSADFPPKFECPKVDAAVALTYPRYADPEDCQHLYVCLDAKSARRVPCKLGKVFNEATKQCDWPRNVPECKDWYEGVLTEQQLRDLENARARETSPGGRRT